MICFYVACTDCIGYTWFRMKLFQPEHLRESKLILKGLNKEILILLLNSLYKIKKKHGGLKFKICCKCGEKYLKVAIFRYLFSNLTIYFPKCH